MIAKKRILILTTAYLPHVGGSELAIKNITDRLPEFDFDIITSRLDHATPIQERIGSAHVFRLGNRLSTLEFLLPKNFLPIALCWKAQGLMRTRRYALVHAYQASQAGGAAWLLSFLYPRVPFLLTMQEGKNLGTQPLLLRLFRRLIINRASAITVISAYLKGYILARRPGADVTLIPNGVDVALFRPVSSPEEIAECRRRIGIGVDGPVVISTSRLVEKNGLDAVVEALKHLPGVRLLLVGSGDRESHLRSRADILGISDRVIFAGTVRHEDLPDYLRAADIFIRPSRSEGLGTAFLEAMACGLPVVGSRVGGIPDFLTHGETGMFCEPENPSDIAEKISRLLSDGALRTAIAQKSAALVRERYQWDSAAQAMKRIYDRLT